MAAASRTGTERRLLLWFRASGWVQMRARTEVCYCCPKRIAGMLLHPGDRCPHLLPLWKGHQVRTSFRLRETKKIVQRRAFAGRLGMALATVGLLAGSLTSAVVVAAPANAASFNSNYQNVEHLTCLTSGGIYNGETTVYACNGSSNQTWHYGGTHGAYAQVINNATGQCLSISGGSTASGARAVEVNCSSNDADYWEVSQPYNVAYSAAAFLNQHSQDYLQIACNCGGNSRNVDQVPEPWSFTGNLLWYT
jgi:hypothetical protein